MDETPPNLYRLIVSYRGGAYAGWQRQVNALTIQQVVEEALARWLEPATPVAERPIRIFGASRTDAGVHARGQAAHLVLSRPTATKALVHGTNRFLPEDVRILRAAPMVPTFHARKHALAKEYRYRLGLAPILSPLESWRTTPVRRPLDVPAMQAAATAIVGRHNFEAFALAGGSHQQPFRRILEAEWLEAEDLLTFRVVGEGFLRGMVRALVGTMIEVGSGRRSIEDFRVLLEGRRREEAGPTAPAQGLVLEWIRFPPELELDGDS